MEYKSFITGEKFIDIGLGYFPKGVKDFNPFDCTVPTKWNGNTHNLKIPSNEPIIVYCHIHHVKKMFEDIEINNPLILVSHNSDNSVDSTLFNLRPKNIIKWYSQNVCHEHKDLISIPIGLENERWWVGVKKKEKMLATLQKNKNHKNLLYINHDTRTNPKQRTKPYQLFGNKKWATTIRGINGSNFDSYLDNIFNHKFVLCPDGNGVDTHRLWETLYLKSIPIVKNSINVDFYRDLPILIVDKWEDINPDFLNQKYEEITKKDFDNEKLKIDYWTNKIKKNIL